MDGTTLCGRFAAFGSSADRGRAHPGRGCAALWGEPQFGGPIRPTLSRHGRRQPGQVRRLQRVCAGEPCRADQAMDRGAAGWNAVRAPGLAREAESEGQPVGGLSVCASSRPDAKKKSCTPPGRTGRTSRRLATPGAKSSASSIPSAWSSSMKPRSPPI